jgi:hypothetical protein
MRPLAAPTPAGIEITAAGQPLALLQEGEGIDAGESPKPFWHPLRTLAGATVTDLRPADHPWHKGLQLALTDVSGENFWGGPTYEPGRGYVDGAAVGRVRRDDIALRDEPEAVAIVERLSWIAHDGAVLLREHRTQRVHSVDPHRGLWAIDLDTAIENAADRPLELGSPTTKGRPDAGYSGWVLRLAPAFRGGAVRGATVDGSPLHGEEALRGARAVWAACAATGGGAAVLALGGLSSGPAPRWFVRSAEYPAIGASPHWDEPQTLAPGEALRLTQRFVILDAPPPADELAALAAEFAIGGGTR